MTGHVPNLPGFATPWIEDTRASALEIAEQNGAYLNAAQLRIFLSEITEDALAAANLSGHEEGNRGYVAAFRSAFYEKTENLFSQINAQIQKRDERRAAEQGEEREGAAPSEPANPHFEQAKKLTDIKQKITEMAEHRVQIAQRAGQNLTKGEAVGQLREEGLIPPKGATAEERAAWFAEQTADRGEHNREDGLEGSIEEHHEVHSSSER